MPTPVDRFLRIERPGDDSRQLGASQEWDWRTGRFHGFVDRDQYLIRVRRELFRQLEAEGDSSQGLYYLEDEFNDEDRRRAAVLHGLRQALQSRRLKLAMLQEQQLRVPFSKLERESFASTMQLSNIKDIKGQAHFCTQSSLDSLRDTFQLARHDQPDRVFNISLQPESHMYQFTERAMSLLNYNHAPAAMSWDANKTNLHFRKGGKSSRWNPIERWLKSLSHSSSSGSTDVPNSTSRKPSWTNSCSFEHIADDNILETNSQELDCSRRGKSLDDPHFTKSYFPYYTISSQESEDFFKKRHGSYIENNERVHKLSSASAPASDNINNDHLIKDEHISNANARAAHHATETVHGSVPKTNNLISPTSDGLLSPISTNFWSPTASNNRQSLGDRNSSKAAAALGQPGFNFYQMGVPVQGVPVPKWAPPLFNTAHDQRYHNFCGRDNSMSVWRMSQPPLGQQHMRPQSSSTSSSFPPKSNNRQGPLSHHPSVR